MDAKTFDNRADVLLQIFRYASVLLGAMPEARFCAFRNNNIGDRAGLKAA
jgi:hypothetical protein